MFEHPALPLLGLMAGIFCTQTAAATQPVSAHAPSVEVCFQHGCARGTVVQLDRSILNRLGRLFATDTQDPAHERAAMAVAIGLLEQFVGARTGTDRDLGGTFPGAFRNGQMDCIDEATNTTRYLRLFAEQGWLQWHDIVPQASRLPVPRGWWPHTTAVIRERISGRQYAVDSWFEANGRPPHIVELGIWRRGWKPSDQQP